MRTCPQCHATYPDADAACPTDGAALEESAIWPEGTLVAGKYRVVAKIGRDVVCTVYKAIDLKSGQFRSLKVMSQELADDPAFVELFEQDAQRRRKLRHANVSRVEAIDESADGLPFIVMEYVAGQSLKKYLELEAPFAPLRACGIAKQVAAGLEAAHALGMVHRDIKPDSIYLLDSSGGTVVKLLGLGVASLQEALLGDRFRYAPEAVIGTFEYLSPEQALGKLGSELDGRADLYSLGVVMYQMLTGHLPFRATTPADWMTSHIQLMPIAIRVAYPDLGIPDVLTDLVMQCLQKNVRLRPASARQLILEIEQAEKAIGQLSKEKEAAPRRRPTRHKPSGWKFW